MDPNRSKNGPLDGSLEDSENPTVIRNQSQTERRLTPVNLQSSPCAENPPSTVTNDGKSIQVEERTPAVSTIKLSVNAPLKKNTTKDFFFGKIIGEGEQFFRGHCNTFRSSWDDARTHCTTNCFLLLKDVHYLVE